MNKTIKAFNKVAAIMLTHQKKKKKSISSQ